MRLTTALLNKLYHTMGRNVFTPQEAARTIVWAATARQTEVANGAYYVPPWHCRTNIGGRDRREVGVRAVGMDPEDSDGSSLR